MLNISWLWRWNLETWKCWPFTTFSDNFFALRSHCSFAFSGRKTDILLTRKANKQLLRYIHFYIFLEHSEENGFTTNDWFLKILFSDRIQVLLRFSTPLRSALPKQRHRRKRKFYKSTTFCNSGLKFWTVRGLKSEKNRKKSNKIQFNHALHLFL